ncbi:MAG TPA: PBP1A family penicillin-binding protein [Allosphingosinicella sp.]|nr:PBP1A family penicillin-binding protein [Allosphingosinicella sp.]
MASTALNRVKRYSILSLKVFGYGLLLALIALGVAVSVAVSQLPSYDELIRRDNLGQMIRVRAADGSIIHTQGPSFGEWLPHDRIPDIMRNAMIAIEDRRYHAHPGVDPIGILRSFAVRFRSGNWSQGGSTITQQLARNIFLNNTRTFGRKMREAILAMALEWRFSKDQILELYLNRVYFGGGAYGIDAASRRFFGHGATQLSVEEAAIIAGLVKAPSNYSPTADIEAARGRAGVVLRQMQEQEYITSAQASAADPQAVPLADGPEPRTATRYFTDWILPQLDTLLDQKVTEPIEVWTTIDVGLQGQADRAIAANVPNGAQGALVSLDRDGAVRAMVGGLDYVTSNYNRATQANRQPGSAWKLFVYLAALETGYTPDSNVDASPITIKGWSPRGSAAGPVPLRKAFALSINTAAVRLAQEVGFGTVADMARRFGITTPVSTNPAMALGSSEVRLVDMVRAYASVANQGVAVAPYGVRRVTTAGGTVVYEHHVDGSRTLVTPWVAAQMTDLLQSVVASGTGRGAALGRPTAGKTGTTSSEKDGYFVGFSSGLTTGVWIGRDDNRRIPGLAGGKNPASTFHDYMAAAVSNRPVEQFTTEVATPEWQTEEAVEELPSEGGMMVDPEGAAFPADEPTLPEPDQTRTTPALPQRQPEEQRDFTPEDRPEPVRIPLRPAPQRTPPAPRLPTPPPPEPEPAVEEDL